MNNIIIYIRNIGSKFASRKNTKQHIFFLKRLGFLLQAEIPLLESLTILAEQSSGQAMKRRIQAIAEDVASGQSLARSAKRHHFLEDFVIEIIRIGEFGGMLSKNLEYVTKELEKRNALKSKLISACVYPLIVTIATFAITAFLLLYLFPKIVPVFMSLRVQLPLSTRIVIAFSEFVKSYWLVGFVGILVLTISLVVSIKRYRKIRVLYDSVSLRIPIIGGVLRSYYLSHITRTTGLLLQSGIAVSDILPIVSNLVPNVVYQTEIRNIGDFVFAGATVSSSMAKNYRLFPELMVHIISVGEKTGNLSSSFLYMSDYYEKEVDVFTKNISTILEPLLMVVMGMIVGFIAISIITPIYGITQNLHP